MKAARPRRSRIPCHRYHVIASPGLQHLGVFKKLTGLDGALSAAYQARPHLPGSLIRVVDQRGIGKIVREFKP